MDILKQICCRLNMEMTKRVTSFEKNGLLDPTNEEHSIGKLAQVLENTNWATYV